LAAEKPKVQESSNKQKKSAPSKSKGQFSSSVILASVLQILENDPNYLSVSLSVPQTAKTVRSKEIKALLDTGSLAGDFIAFRVIDELKLNHFIIVDKKKTVCSALDNKCYDISRSIILSITYFREDINKNDTFEMKAIILSSSPVDLLIGRNTIKLHSLFEKVPSQLMIKNSVQIQAAVLEHVSDTGCLSKSCGYCVDNELIAEINGPKRYPHSTQSEIRVATQTHGLVGSLVKESRELFGVSPYDDDEIDYDKIDTFSPWLKPFDQSNPLSEIHISGSEKLQQMLRALVTEFQDIFSDNLSERSAVLPPFTMEVDDAKWRVPKNRAPPRPQSTENQAELVRQIEVQLKQGIIERSYEPYYSQVLLVPKPGGKKRVCIDFRYLNQVTKDVNHPLPHIQQMLRRIGSQRPKIFGVMDLTQGYHQAPLSMAARGYTAFIVFCGVYQFTRLPFGPKGAPSYFQEMMTTVVLVGLIYNICEMYIDDLNIYATTEDQFIDRCRQIFLRFRKHNLFAKASKCYFGFAELDYVGKVLTEKGLKMSQKKIQSVLDFPVPIYAKHLKSFLGTANYFRDFIRNHSMIVAPLNQMIVPYKKNSNIKVIWTPELINAFHEIKNQVSECTTLYFLDDTAPITLHTDASDYGIGGYLFQTIDEDDKPIAFVSKSLTKTQLRWSVIQKEAYAIYYCCIFLESLLRDRPFTIRTDHRNLLFISEASNPMIVRWYMALSEYQLHIEFISGIENDIADSMSRLCRNNMLDNRDEYSKTDIHVASIIEKFTKLTTHQYKTIGKVHNSVVGHFGLERTLKRLKDLKQVWKFQRNHVRFFIDNCPCCQKMSVIKPSIHAHPFTTSTYAPMECINIDFVGPYQDGGYLLVFIDTFTRWVEIYPTEDASALSAAKCLLQHFGRFGAPNQLRSDNGPHFIAEVIAEFLSLVGTQHCLTLAYSKEENAIVERVIKEINRHLRALTFDTTDENYKTKVPFVQRILNSNYSDRLKISASQLLFGKMINLDVGIFIPRDEIIQSKKPLSKYMSDLLLMQDNLLKASAKELLRTDLLHMTSKELFEHKEFPIGSYVLVHYRTGAPPSRLHTCWRGPLKVVNGKDSRYTLLDLISGKETIYHVSDMKVFNFDPAIVNPLDIARRDHMEHFVFQVYDMEGNPRRKKSLKFKVKWLNHNESEDSWEPFANLRDTQALHEYLRSKNLLHLIPKKFKV
jgi:transposase InsO family protein